MSVLNFTMAVQKQMCVISLLRKDIRASSCCFCCKTVLFRGSSCCIINWEHSSSAAWHTTSVILNLTRKLFGLLSLDTALTIVLRWQRLVPGGWIVISMLKDTIDVVESHHVASRLYILVIVALDSSRFDQGIIRSGLCAIISSSVWNFSLIVALNFVDTRFGRTSTRPSSVITLLVVNVEAVSNVVWVSIAVISSFTAKVWL